MRSHGSQHSAALPLESRCHDGFQSRDGWPEEHLMTAALEAAGRFPDRTRELVYCRGAPQLVHLSLQVIPRQYEHTRPATA
jgi:hypothetical protein